MAIVQRFFSTAGAGAADGTTWANRAALFSAGNWSTVITGFNFAGTDSLECFIGPGTYTCSQTLASGLFTNAPTIANPLLLCGCDSSGVLLSIPDPKWLSCQPAWDASALPVIATTTNVATSTLANADWLLIKFTASGRNGAVVTGFLGLTWCVVSSTTSNTLAQACAPPARNCVLLCSGSSYDTIVASSIATPLVNCRLEGVTGSSGNRRGFTKTGGNVTGTLIGCTVVNNGGEGVISTAAVVGDSLSLHRCVVANNGSTGVKGSGTAAQTSPYDTHDCMITGNGTAGIDGNAAAARWTVAHNRLRDNTTNITGLGNYPTDLNNYTTDSDDATEYIAAGANGDFSIKNTAAIWGQGFGVRDEPAASPPGTGTIAQTTVAIGPSWAP